MAPVLKHRLKTQLNAFSIWALYNITTSTSKTHFNAFHPTKGKEKKKNVVNLVFLAQKQETRSTYLKL